MIPIAIHGAAGRMGRRLIALATEDPQLKVVAAWEHAACPQLGQDAGVVAGVASMGVPITTTGQSSDARVVIDFSLPPATRALVPLAADRGVALVVGTTGLIDADQAMLDQAARKVAVLQAPNMSLGVNLLFAVAGQVAARLGVDYDIEIVEAHHRFKKDAPSGTALGIAQAICNATGRDLQKDVVHGRQGHDVPRKPGQIGMHALRMGDVVGDHTVTFAALGEQFTLGHHASTRDIFARGALHAAKWIAQRSPGRYAMKDVLGL